MAIDSIQQTNEEKQKYIEDSLRIFRETLEKTFLNSDSPFYGIAVNNLTAFQNGNFTRKKDGNLTMTIGLPSWYVKKDKLGLPIKFSDWAAFPIVINLNAELMN